MIIKCLPNGMISSNCYIVGDNGEALLIDAGVDTPEILQELDKLKFKLKYIVLTHGHFDHICSVDELREKTGAKVLIHTEEAEALTDSQVNGSLLFGLKREYKEADILLKDGDTVEIGGLKLHILHTPGHSPGCICILGEKNLFTGDTLFRMSIGRTDLGNGDHSRLMASIQNKLLMLEDDIIVYPGHGPSTTIGYERKHNPFFKRELKL